MNMKRRFISMVSSLVIIGLVYTAYENFAAKKTERHAPASADKLHAQLTAQTLPPWKKPSDLNPKLAAWGQKLFFDPGFSANGQVSCATCHDPNKSFTDGKKNAAGVAQTDMNAPAILNPESQHWFFANGRADSLAMQVLGPLENPKEHGFTRVKVLKHIAATYRTEYLEFFGPLPDLAKASDDLPASHPPRVTDAVAAFALGTLGNTGFQKLVIDEAAHKSVQPVEIIKDFAAGSDQSPTAFDAMPEADQHDINQAFANVGRAIAEFERTIHTEPSPFDTFAAKVSAGATPEDVFTPDFGAGQWAGYKLFVGEANCVLCHQGPHFTDQQFHNIGMMALSDNTIDLGRSQGILLVRNSPFRCDGPYLKQEIPSESCGEQKFIETENSEMLGAFKTPSLRNLRDTAPYGHDGRFPNLRDILQHYNHFGVPTNVGHTEESLKPMGLKDAEIANVESFLLSLYGPIKFGLEGDSSPSAQNDGASSTSP